MTRWKASAIHLALSALVLLSIAAVVVWRWYPPGLFHMAQADRLLSLIAMVDVVVGPLLTLVIYKQGKKSLKFDLAVIALLQLAAMGYGLYTVWQSRPVYLVATVDRFQLVFANLIDPKDLEDAPPQFRKLPWLTVETIAAVLPASQQERQDLLFSALGGKDVHVLPKYYVPYRNAANALRERAMPATELAAQLSEQEGRLITQAIRKSGLEPSQLRALPIASDRGDATMLLHADDGGLVAPVAVDPWPVYSAWDARRAQAKSN